LLRGRYEGFIRNFLQSEPGKLVDQRALGQVEGCEGS
jgi:hypothetical protein